MHWRHGMHRARTRVEGVVAAWKLHPASTLGPSSSPLQRWERLWLSTKCPRCGTTAQPTVRSKPLAVSRSCRRYLPSTSPPLRSFASSASSTPSSSLQPLSSLRNVGIIAHIDAGKTTTTERFLFFARRLRHPGDVDRGDTHTDFLPEERRRGITIKAASTRLSWRDHTITLIDTPGHVDFTQEVEGSMRVMDGAVLVLDAVKGVQAQTWTVYRQAQRYRTPVVAWANKMDRDGADLDATCRSITQRLGKPALALQLPLYASAGTPSSLHGVVDLVTQEEVLWDGDEQGIRYSRRPLTESHLQWSSAQSARDRLLEGLAERDDGFLAAFLSNTAPSAAVIRESIRRLSLANAIIPVLCGSSLRNTGVQLLMDAVVDYLPSPTDCRPITVHSPIKALGKRGRSGGGRHHRHGSRERSDAEGERVVEVAEKGPLLALAFKVTHDLLRGAVPIVFVRVYSGRLHVKDVLVNTSAPQRSSASAPRERVLKVLHVDGEEQVEVPSIGPGCIGALVGLQHVVSGDTLVRAGEEEVRMDGMLAPEPVFFAAVEADSADEEQRLTEALRCIVREDDSVSVARSEDTGQTVLRGQGQLHLEIVFHRLVHDFRVKAQLGKVRVAYREGVTEPGEAELYAVQAGADAALAVRLEPLEAGSGVTVDVEQAERWTAEEALTVAEQCSLSPASVSAPPLPVLGSTSLPLTPALGHALQSTLLSALQRGPLSGFPMLDVALTVTRYFLSPATTAASLRSTAALLTRRLLEAMAARGAVVVLEPMMSVTVVAEKRDVGEVLTDLTGARRASIGEVDGAGAGEGDGSTVREEIRAEVPLIEMVGYADVLRSRTKGTATYSMSLSNYAAVPHDVQRRLLE